MGNLTRMTGQACTLDKSISISHSGAVSKAPGLVSEPWLCHLLANIKVVQRTAAIFHPRLLQKSGGTKEEDHCNNLLSIFCMLKGVSGKRHCFRPGGSGGLKEPFRVLNLHYKTTTLASRSLQEAYSATVLEPPKPISNQRSLKPRFCFFPSKSTAARCSMLASFCLSCPSKSSATKFDIAGP